MQRRLLLALAALLLGCQETSLPAGTAETASAPPVVSGALQLGAEGDALMRAGDHRTAADRYRQAVALAPDQVASRFSLATAYTFLDRRADAIEQFRWVVGHADPGSVESREARRWLTGAGIPVESRLVASEPTGESAPGADAGQAAPLVGGRLIGSTQWPGIDPKVRAVSGELWLTGIDGATDGVKRSRPLRLGSPYHFYDIPPGQYRLVARMASYPEDVTLWDQKVNVVDGAPTELALTPATARLSPDTFPPPVK